MGNCNKKIHSWRNPKIKKIITLKIVLRWLFLLPVRIKNLNFELYPTSLGIVFKYMSSCGYPPCSKFLPSFG